MLYWKCITTRHQNIISNLNSVYHYTPLHVLFFFPSSFFKKLFIWSLSLLFNMGFELFSFFFLINAAFCTHTFFLKRSLCSPLWSSYILFLIHVTWLTWLCFFFLFNHGLCLFLLFICFVFLFCSCCSFIVTFNYFLQICLLSFLWNEWFCYTLSVSHSNVVFSGFFNSVAFHMSFPFFSSLKTGLCLFVIFRALLIFLKSCLFSLLNKYLSFFCSFHYSLSG